MLHVSDRHKRGVSTEPKRKSHRWRPTSRVKTYRTRAQQRQLRQGRCQVSDRHLQLLHCLVYQWDRQNNTLKQHHKQQPGLVRSCTIPKLACLEGTKASTPASTEHNHTKSVMIRPLCHRSTVCWANSGKAPPRGTATPTFVLPNPCNTTNSTQPSSLSLSLSDR